MVDRIKKLMEYEGMTSAHFADYIEVGRAVISHILNGRNKPSLEVITKILAKIDYIDSNWLLSGEGEMLKPNFSPKDNQTDLISEEPVQRDLFGTSKPQENQILRPQAKDAISNRKETDLKQPENAAQNSIKQTVEHQKNEDKKITKIIIYYSDNTFETFNPEKIELGKSK